MTQAGKVAEIFSVAGEAFTKLGNLAMSLQPASTQDGGKWEDEEIDMLRKAVAQFGNDIEKISEKIKTKSAMQIKNTLKHKAVQNLNVNPTIRNTNAQKQTVTTQIQNFTVKTPTMNEAVQHITPKPPGLQHIAVRTPIMAASGQHPSNVHMKPTVMTFQGQNFAVKPPIMTIPSQQQNINVRPPLMSVAGQNLTMKPTGVATPASIITSQLNKTPMKIHNIPRTLGQKTKLDTISVTGMMSLADVQNATKKVKLDSPNLNILTSTLLSQKPMIRSQTPGIPGVVSSQGFQVLMPSSSKNMYPISVRPSGIVQRVADANTTTGNVDVES